MRLFRAARRTLVGELLNAILEPCLFADKVPPLGNDHFLVGRAVLAKRLAVDEDGFEERSKEPSDPNSGWVEPATGPCPLLPNSVPTSGRRPSFPTAARSWAVTGRCGRCLRLRSL